MKTKFNPIMSLSSKELSQENKKTSLSPNDSPPESSPVQYFAMFSRNKERQCYL